MKSLKFALVGLCFCLVSVNAVARRNTTSIRTANTASWISSQLSSMIFEMCINKNGNLDLECVKFNNGQIVQIEQYEAFRTGNYKIASQAEADLLPSQVRRDVLSLIAAYEQHKINVGGSLKSSNTVKRVFLNYLND